MPKYDEEFLDTINGSVKLIDYIGQFIELRKHGENWFGHCPWHVDKTASFCVNERGNYYHCFSCGRGGKIINFLIDYKSLSFSEAVEEASRISGIDTKKMCQSESMKYNRMLRRKKSSSEKFKHQIIQYSEYDKFSQEPIPEWENEGIDPQIIRMFDVRIDHRGNRIVYPVYDNDENLINIKGRTRYSGYKKLGVPKYINYYKVGRVDYFQGLNVTKAYILEKKEIIIFEGIKSVMKLMSFGIKNSVSAEKHNLTIEQIRILIRLGVDVVLAYDADVNYKDKKIEKDINTLKRFAKVSIIEDRYGLLGGAEKKNSPVDCGLEIWTTLYNERRFV